MYRQYCNGNIPLIFLHTYRFLFERVSTGGGGKQKNQGVGVDNGYISPDIMGIISCSCRPKATSPSGCSNFFFRFEMLYL